MAVVYYTDHAEIGLRLAVADQTSSATLYRIWGKTCRMTTGRISRRW